MDSGYKPPRPSIMNRTPRNLHERSVLRETGEIGASEYALQQQKTELQRYQHQKREYDRLREAYGGRDVRREYQSQRAAEQQRLADLRAAAAAEEARIDAELARRAAVDPRLIAQQEAAHAAQKRAWHEQIQSDNQRLEQYRRAQLSAQRQQERQQAAGSRFFEDNFLAGLQEPQAPSWLRN